MAAPSIRAPVTFGILTAVGTAGVGAWSIQTGQYAGIPGGVGLAVAGATLGLATWWAGTHHKMLAVAAREQQRAIHQIHKAQQNNQDRLMHLLQTIAERAREPVIIDRREVAPMRPMVQLVDDEPDDEEMLEVADAGSVDEVADVEAVADAEEASETWPPVAATSKAPTARTSVF